MTWHRVRRMSNHRCSPAILRRSRIRASTLDLQAAGQTTTALTLCGKRPVSLSPSRLCSEDG